MYGVIHKIFKISLGLSFGDRAHKGLGFRVKGFGSRVFFLALGRKEVIGWPRLSSAPQERYTRRDRVI